MPRLGDGDGDTEDEGDCEADALADGLWLLDALLDGL